MSDDPELDGWLDAVEDLIVRIRNRINNRIPVSPGGGTAGSTGVGTLPGLLSPVISFASTANDNRPDFFVDIPSGNGAPGDTIAGDQLTIQYKLGAGSFTTYVSHTITSGEITGSPIAITGVGALADGDYSFKAFLGRSGYANSADSPTITETIDTVAPTITTASTANVNEGDPLAIALTADEAIASWTITGGVDAAQYAISGSTLTWVGNGVQSFAAPADADANNTYIVQVTATDTAGNSTNKTITVTVLDVVLSITYTSTDHGQYNPGFATSITVTSANIGSPSADRIVTFWLDLGNGFPDFTSDMTVTPSGGSPIAMTKLTFATATGVALYYANVPTGTTATFAASGASSGLGSACWQVGQFRNQSGGGTAVPTAHDIVPNPWVFQNDPYSTGSAIPVSAGGITQVFGVSGFPGSSGTPTWSGVSSSAGDTYDYSPSGNDTQFATAHMTASSIVTLSVDHLGSKTFSGGTVGYVEWAA